MDSGDIILLAKLQGVLSFLSCVWQGRPHSDEILYYAERLDDMIWRWQRCIDEPEHPAEEDA